MDPVFFKSAGAVLGLLIAWPIVSAAIKAGEFFGSSKANFATLTEKVTALTETLTDNARRWDDSLNDHGERITRVETHLGIQPDRRKYRRES